MNNTKKATLRYAATAPTLEQINSIKAVLSKNLQNEEVEIEAILDPSVGGGFIVNCGNFEYDWSDQGRAKQLRAELNTAALGHGEVISGRIITMLKEKVEDFELSINGREVGEVT